MKRSLPWIALLLYCLSGGVLLFQMTFEKPHSVVVQKSNFAIINISDPEMADALASGEIEIKTNNPNDKVLLRVTSGHPTHIRGKIKSTGQLYVINPAGVIVGEPGVMQKSDSRSTLEAEVIPHGNVYALALQEEGGIRASRTVNISVPLEKDELFENSAIISPNLPGQDSPNDDR